MAPQNPRIKKAFNVMKEIGISEAKVKPVLKKLLKLYDKNWELIEADSYAALVEAIFDQDEAEEIEERKGKKKTVEPGKDPEEEEDTSIEPERLLKRVRRRGKGGSSSLSLDISSFNWDDTLLKKPKIWTEEPLPLPLPVQSSSSHPKVDLGIILLPKQRSPDTHALIIPKDEPFTDEMPLDVIPSVKSNSSVPEIEIGETNGQEPSETQNAETENKVNGCQPSDCEMSRHELAKVPAESSSLEIASSPLGEVKISLSCSSSIAEQNFRLPSLDHLRKAMEEKCLRSYKILDPNFSVINLMNDMCSCFLELATNSSNQSPDNLTYITPNIDILKKSAAHEAAFSWCAKETIHNASRTSNGELDGFAQNDREMNDKDADFSDSQALVVVPEYQVTADEWRSLNDFNDITRGEEQVQISWANEINNKLPPPFYYIPQSLLFQNALVNFPLSGVGDDQCCSSCFGDCLASPVPCACVSQTGGFVYTSTGLLKEDFLEECISMTRDPHLQCLETCRECPLEKAKKEEILEPCKGHLKRKIIKECWRKCGCNKKCGNRVVQQGIRNKLQVFFTHDGKGWGLRTLEKLPKGAFVCEYAGEILTITELYQRISEKHTSPVILDAHWGSGEVSRDERALCLDAMRYGNIAKFINHRCLDANLIEVPVELETPEHHYYHLAFFTTRDIDAMEELTWDYGVDFDEDDYPVKVFQCLCGSKFCRNMKRVTRGKHALNGR